MLRYCLPVLLPILALVSCQQHHYGPHTALTEPPEETYRGYKMAPYTVRGMRFVPMNVEQALRYTAVGTASHYEAGGARGAIGERLHRGEFYAAHRTLPLPCVARVTNVETGVSCEVRVADRGPYIAGRLIDLSTAAARYLGFHTKGLGKVKVQVLSVGDGAYKRTR